MKLRLWNDLYLIQGRYIVLMGIPNKTSSLNDLNGLDVIPIPIWQLTSHVQQDHPNTGSPHFLCSAYP